MNNYENLIVTTLFVFIKRYLINNMLFLCITLLSLHAYAETSIKTIDDFKRWASDKVLCQSSVEVPVESRQFADQIKALHFGLKLDVDAETKNYEGMITIPNSAVKIFDFIANKIDFGQDSGVLFRVYIKTNPIHLVDLVKSKGLAKYPLIDGKDEIGKFVFLTTPPTKNNPYGEKQQAIVINTTDEENISTIECRIFDY